MKNKKKEILIEKEEIKDISLNEENLHNLLLNSDKESIKEIINNNSPISIADVLNHLSENEAILFFSLSVNYIKLGEIFSYLLIEYRSAVIKTLEKKKLILVIAYTKNDDLSDYLNEVPKSIREKVVSLLPQKRKKEIESLASYSDDTIGSIMTTEFLGVNQEVTVNDILKKIKEVGNQLETVRTIFVVDKANKLVGLKKLEELIFFDEKENINDIMDKDFAYISPLAYKEEAIPICKKYDLATLPVVSKNGEMLGIITFDDVMDVIEEENTEDILKQAGVALTDKSYLESKPFRMALSYVIWLIVIAVINTFSSIIISKAETILEVLSALVIFFPVLNDTGGNSGNQTTSTVIRALATNEITTKDYFKVALKELLVGFISALCVGLFNFAWVQVEFHTHLINIDSNQIISIFGSLSKGFLIIGMIVSITLVISITLSKLLGATLPIVARLVKIDPAFISGPLISCIMDIITLLIYFGISTSILSSFLPGIFGGVL